MTRATLLFLLAACGCNASASAHDGAVVLDAGSSDQASFDLPPADLTPAPARTVLLTLDAGAFPPSASHPSALVYLPRGYDPTPPLAVVVFLHGWNNCVENVVRDAGAPCAPGAGARQAYSLAAQLESSGKNALLLCPEVVFDQPTGNPGTLASAGGFRALLAEVLHDLEPVLGAHTITDVGEVVVASHSGGYLAAAGISSSGGVPIAELYLLDSLYGSTAQFDAWVTKDLASLAGTSPLRRFADLYTSGGGTLANSQQMADRAATWVSPDAGILVDDRTGRAWSPADYGHGLLFKYTTDAHDDVPRNWFGPLVATSRLPPRR